MKHDITIDIRNLVTGYSPGRDPNVVTCGISASLRSGELTCLLGPNGAGKSTLLKTLSSFLPPLDGDITLLGRPLRSYSNTARSRLIGVVLTDRVSLDNMSARELAGLGRTPYTGFWGRLSVDDKAIVDEALELVGISGLADRMVDTLSDGERQKVMIAKALVQQTPVIFLDEPTAFLDYPSKVELMQLLLSLSRDHGKTIFMSTHDIELALLTADKVWLIDKPHGVATGTPEDLALDGSLARYFEREGVKFDMSTGMFSVSFPTRRTVAVKGDGARYNMMVKALARNAIALSDASSDEIVVTPDAFMYGGENFCDIASLLDKLL
ncbi:MAG: ABC transporter ATP-binding protein [Muribaculum sp.]|nr:ABC transporter ATP-binding protein [Muribaculum sp.]